MDIIERSYIKREIPYFQVPNDIFDLSLDLTIQEKIVYVYLCRCSNQGAQAFPSYQTIADKCSMSKRSAMYAIDGLIDCGLLQKETRQKDNKDNMSNVYIVNEPADYHQPIKNVKKTKGKKVDPSANLALPSASVASPSSASVALPSASHAPYKELYKKNHPFKKKNLTYPQKKKIRFTDYEQRQYNFDELEKGLLGWDRD